MKHIISACLVLLLLPSLTVAQIDKRYEADKQDIHDNRLDDLKDQVYDIKYDLINRISSQNHLIKQQDNEITELKLKIKDLEHNLFQTTQSLRNLELEVWDMKKSLNQKMKANE